MDEGILYNANIASRELIPAPNEVREQYPATPKAQTTVLETRHAIRQILTQEDPRLLVVVGPCSVHDLDAAMEYAERLKGLKIQPDELKMIDILPPEHGAKPLHSPFLSKQASRGGPAHRGMTFADLS